MPRNRSTQLSTLTRRDSDLLNGLIDRYGKEAILGRLIGLFGKKVLLVELAKKRPLGRPKKLQASNASLVLLRDELVEKNLLKAVSKAEARRLAVQSIFEEISKEDADGVLLAEGTRRSITIKTVERYLREGERQLRDGEIRLAMAIDRVADQVGLEAALAHGDYGCGSYGGELKRRYERGKRALKKAEKYSE